MKTKNVLAGLGMLSLILSLTSCLPRHSVIPDSKIPHKLAADADVYIWVKREDGKLQKEQVRALKGWWIASPEVVE